MDERTPSWGIEPVPDRLRVLGLLDLTLLWGNLSVSLLVIVAAAGLVPALSFKQALLAILIGSLAGSVLLGLAGAIGADARVPGMVLLRSPLGRRGSYAPTVLNVAQNVGWATFELIVIAAAANALADSVFGFRERWVWVLVFGAITLAMALAGPVSFVRRYVRRFAVWAVAASVGYLTWWALDGASTGDLWSADPAGGITFWQGVDLTVAMAASWLPLAADYTRFARRPRHAFWGTAAGYFVPLVWLYGLGALLFLSRGTSDATALLTSVAAGGIASALALVALTVGETDEPFANVYSAAVSIQNLVPEAPQWLLVLGVGGLAITGALVVDLGEYQSFLLLLGSFFVPLFGVLAAEFLYGSRPTVSVRWSGIAAWLAGVALYQWIQPTGPAWWVDAVERVPGAGDFTGGASLPSFALAFALFAALRYAHA